MIPQHIEHIVIVGGGTAGWMAAASLSHFLRHQPTRITLVEAPNVPTVGVGEATLPGIRNFNAELGIDEVDFIRKTQASFKLGIRFRDWLRPGSDFFHPFADYGVPLSGVPFDQCFIRARQSDPALQLADYSLPTLLAHEERFAQPSPEPEHPLLDYKYAFHFDALLYAAYLRDYAVERGVRHLRDTVGQVQLNPDSGYIEQLDLNSGATVEGELFIDCTGFRGVLIEDALNTGYEDWSHWLPVDAAWAVGSEVDKDPTPYTVSTAREAGWTWRIPLQHRCGNGYVFSSQYCDADTAQETLLECIDGKPLAEPRLLRFTTGMRKRFWHRNCIALGLASGFLEPLESTSIALIQTGLSKLLMFYPEHGFNNADIAEANRLARLEMERIRDFLILHYQPSQREGAFWQDRRNMALPDTLRHKVDLFRQRGHLVSLEMESFQLASWLSIFYGMGIEPAHCGLRAGELPSDQLQASLTNMRTALASAAAKAPRHGDFIQRHCAAPALSAA